MNEPKLCPYRNRETFRIDTEGTCSPDSIEFLPCLQEKCAMWRTRVTPIDKNDIEYITKRWPNGYCGLAGNP